MTMNNRAAAHRILKARQDPSLTGSGGDGGPTGPTGGGGPTISTPSTPSTPTKSSTKSTPTPTPTSTRSTPPPPPPTTRTTTSKSTPTTAATSATETSSNSDSSSSESTSSSTSVSNTSSSSRTNTGTTLIAASNTPVQFLPTSVISPTITSTDGLDAATDSPTSTDVTASGGIKTGAVVGGVVGALGAIAIIGMIVAFFLRRWRRSRGGDDDFDPTQFVRSSTVMDSEFRGSPTSTTPYRASTFDPIPPSMGQREAHTASIVSGPGMAGYGAYTAPTGMQQQPQYAYGHGYDAGQARDDEGSELAHGGPYSSEPQPQHAYNPESYGSFAYSTEGPHAVQQQPYHPYQAEPQYPGYRDEARAPALVAGAPAVPAGRSSRQSVAVKDDDVYGGI